MKRWKNCEVYSDPNNTLNKSRGSLNPADFRSFVYTKAMRTV